MKKFLLSIFAVMLAVFSVQAEEVKYSFSSYTAGTQYAQGEKHALDENVTLVINGAHLNTQVRLYAGSNAVFESKRDITKVVLNAGNKVGTLTVNVSNDGSTWVKVKDQTTTTSYTAYTFDLGGSYKYVQMVSTGAQIRVSIATLTFSEDAGGEGGGTVEPDPEPDPEPETPVEPEIPVGGSSWILVENVSDINAGDEIVIAYNNFGLGAKSNTSTVYHTKVDIKTTNDGKALTDIGDAKVLTVGKNGDSYTFSYDGNYLYWSSGNSLATSSSVTENSSWTITISNGVATIKNVKDNTRILQYNTSSPRFACYTGTQKDVRIYKKVETSSASYTLSVTDAEWATLYLDFAVTIPAGVEVWTVSEIVDGYVVLGEVLYVIPAGCPVLVKASMSGEYDFKYTAETGNEYVNLLKGTTVNTYITEEAYVLGKVDGEVGFYKALMTDGQWLNNANKAYLPVSALPKDAQGAASFSFRFEGGTTGVEEVKTENGEVKAIYDLTGRQVNAVERGIYIINGKKVLVK